MKEEAQKSSPADLVTRMADAQELAKDPEVVKEVRKYGKVPVVYLPTKKMLRPSQDPGLRHFILQATTAEEVENLLKRGEEYKNVSSGTVRKWKKAAAKRLGELCKAQNKQIKELIKKSGHGS